MQHGTNGIKEIGGAGNGTQLVIKQGTEPVHEGFRKAALPNAQDDEQHGQEIVRHGQSERNGSKNGKDKLGYAPTCFV
ncbi:hypothetical protein ACA910_016295 [Epithemia clementina (nom. ined.)]